MLVIFTLLLPTFANNFFELVSIRHKLPFSNSQLTASFFGVIIATKNKFSKFETQKSTIFAKTSILDVWQGSEYASAFDDLSQNSRKQLQMSFLK